MQITFILISYLMAALNAHADETTVELVQIVNHFIL